MPKLDEELNKNKKFVKNNSISDIVDKIVSKKRPNSVYSHSLGKARPGLNIIVKLFPDNKSTKKKAV